MHLLDFLGRYYGHFVSLWQAQLPPPLCTLFCEPMGKAPFDGGAYLYLNITTSNLSLLIAVELLDCLYLLLCGESDVLGTFNFLDDPTIT